MMYFDDWTRREFSKRDGWLAASEEMAARIGEQMVDLPAKRRLLTRKYCFIKLKERVVYNTGQETELD